MKYVVCSAYQLNIKNMIVPDSDRIERHDLSQGVDACIIAWHVVLIWEN